MEIEKKEVERKMGSIPEDMKVEILSKLPAKSLYRFSSACKSWNSLLCPEFIRFRDKDRKLFLLFHGCYSTLDCYEATFDSDVNASMITVESPFKESAEVMASCGSWLLLSCQTSHRLWLFNPGTRECKEFQSCNDPYISHKFYGICYDYSQNEHKVVSVVSPGGEPKLWPFCFVFSFETNSWTISRDFPYLAENDQQGVSINGAPHWVCYYYAATEYGYCRVNVILCFDMKEEKFIEVPKPHNSVSFYDPFYLAAMGGNLFAHCHSFCSLTIWEMQEYGVKESWINVCNIRPSITMVRMKPLAFTKKGELIILSNDGKEIIIYNQEADISKRLMRFEKPMVSSVVTIAFGSQC